MKVLFLDWPCFGHAQLLNALQEADHTLLLFSHEDYNKRSSKKFDEAFRRYIDKEMPDVCFSFNYFHLLACCCYKFHIKYISMVYDCPYLMLYSYSLIYPTNFVFLFDKQQYFELKREGIQTVYYFPLPVDGEFLIAKSKRNYNNSYYKSDVSFVGSLYNEEHNFFDDLYNLDGYTQGYLDAIMQSQLKISGYNFIEEVLTPHILKNIQRKIMYQTADGGTESLSYVVANYFINRKLTAIERYKLLSLVAKTASLKVFTHDANSTIPNAIVQGTVDYISEMPIVFQNSKINLNITLRSIKSGIPLRALDIMSVGGFLLTNYQEDFLDYFIPGEDFIYYEKDEDLIDKVEYYLQHEKERKEIARNGFEKTKLNLNYKNFLEHIFSVAGIKII